MGKRIGLWLMMLFLLCISSAAGEGRTRALLVGADRFCSMPQTAPAAKRNLERMENLLWIRWPGLTECRAVLNGLGTVDGLRRLIAEEFAETEAEDTSLIYFTSHGIRFQDGRTALLLSDGISEENLTPEQLAAITEMIPGRKVLILDACYSGGFIGKGMMEGENPFRGSDTLVLTSAGGMEESALWLDEEAGAGGSWFLAALEALLTGQAGPGDSDGDGFFSLREVREGVRALCGDSRACCYPEDDAAPLFSVGESNPDGEMTDLQFLTGEEEDLHRPRTAFAFTVESPLRLWYRMVYWTDDRWDFEGAVQLPDRERYGGIRGNLEPGEKQRTVRLTTVNGEESGYALLQLMTMRDEVTGAAGSRRIALTGDREISVRLECPESFAPAFGEELNAMLIADGPCAVTVCVETDSGEVLRTLCEKEACLPCIPEAGGQAILSLCWSGLTDAGEAASEGVCRLHAVWTDALGFRECFSAPFLLSGNPEEKLPAGGERNEPAGP